MIKIYLEYSPKAALNQLYVEIDKEKYDQYVADGKIAIRVNPRKLTCKLCGKIVYIVINLPVPQSVDEYKFYANFLDEIEDYFAFDIKTFGYTPLKEEDS